jgi:hypothetical protein
MDRRSKFNVRTIKDFAKLSRDARVEFLRTVLLFDENKVNDVVNVCKLIPMDMDVVFSYAVDEHDDTIGVTAGSIVTMKAIVSRPGVPAVDKSDAGFVQVHAPYLDEPKTESWLYLVAEKGKLLAVAPFKSVRDGSRLEARFQAPEKGSHELDCYLLSDSYVGFDSHQKVTLNVKNPAPVKQVEAEEEKAQDSDEEFDVDDDELDDIGSGSGSGSESTEDEEDAFEKEKALAKAREQRARAEAQKVNSAKNTKPNPKRK